MSSEEVTRLRSGKIIELATNSQSPGSPLKTEPNTVDTESVGDSSVSSQIAEIKDAMKGNLMNYIRKLDN